jgi:hypothetical protein
VREWALQMAGVSTAYPGTQARAASYLELAVLVGHQAPAQAGEPREERGRRDENEPGDDWEEETA